MSANTYLVGYGSAAEGGMSANTYVTGFGASVGRWPPVVVTPCSQVIGPGGLSYCWSRVGTRGRYGQGWMRANPWRARLREVGP